jgi:hypothetical protein
VLERLIRRGDLKWNRKSAVAIIWAGWARVSPASLRWLLTTLLRLRNLAFKRRFVPGRVYEWNPRGERSRDAPLDRREGRLAPDSGPRLGLEPR